METVLVVGVRHLGRELALYFARQEWTVILAARSAEDLKRMALEVEQAGGRAISQPCDLTDAASLVPLASHKIDLCIAAQSPGGRFGARPLVEIAREELTQAFQVSLLGSWNLLQAVGPGMLAAGSGTFLQIGTSSGVRTKERFAALGAVQAGLRALVQVAAKEWRPRGVHVAYLPIDGPIESEKTRTWLAQAGVDKSIPPLEIARACEYLHRQDSRAWTHELLLRPQSSEWTTPT